MCNKVLAQVFLYALHSVVPCIAQWPHNVHREVRPFHKPRVQIVDTNSVLVEQFYSKGVRLNVELPIKSRVRREEGPAGRARIRSDVNLPNQPEAQRYVNPANQARMRRDVNPTDGLGDLKKEDREFLRELKAVLRNSRATYPVATKLMNREHTTQKQKLFVPKDPVVMERNVNSEQIVQILKSSEELVRCGTRLPLWGIATPKDYSPVETPTVDLIRELRNILRDTRGTYASTVLMNREHTKSQKKMLVRQEQMVMDHGVNSRQLAEIIKSSEERDPCLWPLIGMTTSNVTMSTMTTDAAAFIRELRALFRDTRGTYAATEMLPHHAENTKPQRKMGMIKDPILAKYQVNSQQMAEIIKSSEERANPSLLPLIGA